MGNSKKCNQEVTGLHNKNILSFGETEAGELVFLAARWPSPAHETTSLYKLVDPVLRGDPDVCKWRLARVDDPRPVGRVVRRRYIHSFFL